MAATTNSTPLVPLAVVGCDFRVASSAWRSHVVLTPEERRAFAEGLIAEGTASGFVSLDTCNRTEWIVSTTCPSWAMQILQAQMVDRWQRSRPGELSLPVPFAFTGEEAARHVLRVVTGLESFALGEAEIAGQFHRAVEQARTEGTSSPILNGLARAAGRVSRKAVALGFQSSGRSGVQGLALAFLSGRLPPEPTVTVAVVGLGLIGRKVVGLLEEHTPWRVVRLNRTVGSGRGGRPLSDLEEVCAEADAVVLCSGAPHPVLGRDQVVGRPAGGRPLVVLDLGVPQQASAALAAEPGVALFGLDDLPRFATAGEGLVRAVEGAVEAELRSYVRFCGERRLNALLHATQSRHVTFSREVIPRFLDETLPGLPPADRKRLLSGLRGLIRSYTNDIFQSIHEVVEGSSGDDPRSLHRNDH